LPFWQTSILSLYLYDEGSNVFYFMDFHRFECCNEWQMCISSVWWRWFNSTCILVCCYRSQFKPGFPFFFYLEQESNLSHRFAFRQVIYFAKQHVQWPEWVSSIPRLAPVSPLYFILSRAVVSRWPTGIRPFCLSAATLSDAVAYAHSPTLMLTKRPSTVKHSPGDRKPWGALWAPYSQLLAALFTERRGNDGKSNQRWRWWRRGGIRRLTDVAEGKWEWDWFKCELK